MSGHNKWSTIKRKKGALDSKRSKIFSKIIKDITVAVKEGGPDPDSNARLRLAVANAKGANMPKDTLQRAINKAGDKSTAALQELTFECYAPHGIAVFVECLTDNNNRSVAAVRSIFNKFGGTMGTNGSLSFIFQRKGVFQIAIKDADPDEGDDVEMYYLKANCPYFELSWPLYEIIETALPLQRVHPESECNPDMTGFILPGEPDGEDEA